MAKTIGKAAPEKFDQVHCVAAIACEKLLSTSVYLSLYLSFLARPVGGFAGGSGAT